jgi:spore germination cell wall hydrolase CwlJ-like protein
MSVLLTLRIALVATALSFPIHFAKSTEPIKEYSQETLKELYCLTKNIYHEARGESQLGKIAVAQVTMNRANHKTKWPSTVCDVVYQQVKGIPQFSWTTMDTKIVDKKAWQEAKEIAFGVFTGKLFIKNFNFTYFHNKTIEHGQTKINHKVIGNHVFYH